DKVVRVDRDENLRMIADSIGFLADQQKVVVYDAEHFFDGWREDRAYALRCLHAAFEAGAAYLVLCDTNGASLPHEVEEATAAVAGNRRELLISELSGKGTVLQRAEQSGVELDGDAAARVVERVKALEHRGFHFEAADGSFDLLIRRQTGGYEPLFRLESWRV